MSVYDTSIDLYKECCRQSGGKLSLEDLYTITKGNISSSKIGLLTSGEVAAYLTMVDMAYVTSSTITSSSLSESHTLPSRVCNSEIRDADDSFTKTDDASWQNTASADPMSFISKFLEGDMKTESIELPTLTDSEKNSTLGAMLCYVMGLFFSLKQRILDERMLKQSETDVENPTSSLNCENTLQPNTAASWSSSIPNICESSQGHKREVHGRMKSVQLLEEKLEAHQQDFKSLPYPSRVINNQHRAYFYPSNHHELQTNWATYAYHGFNIFRDTTYIHDTNHRDEQDQKLPRQWQVQQQQQQYLMKRDQYYSVPLPTESTPKMSSSRRDPIFSQQQAREGNIGDTIIHSHLSFDHQLAMERYTLNENQLPHEYSTDDLEPYQIPPRNRALSLSLHSLDFDVKDSDESSTDSSIGGENRLQSSNRTVDHKRKSSDPDTRRSNNKYPRTKKAKDNNANMT